MHLYIHIPFCYQKCHYCAFYSQPIKGKGYSHLIQYYLETLHNELYYWSKKLSLQPIQSIFFGGGTPSILPPKNIQAILNNIKKQYSLLPQAEITLETNPESVKTLEQFKEYLHVGINRFSLGIQSLEDQKLLELGRIHTAEKALHAYKILRDAQCTNINIDLIWGLPNQTLQQWITTLKKTIELKPNHISIYNLTIEEKTVFKRKEHQLNLPQEQEQVQMYLQAYDILSKAKLKQYEISNFAQEGYQCIQNKGYWSKNNYLGLGPSATSTIYPYRWTNPPTLSSWHKNIKEQKSPPKEYLSPIIQTKELLMLRLRTTEGLFLKDYSKITGYDFIQTFKDLITPILKNKLMFIENEYVKLTPEGMLLSNTILKKFFAILPKNIRV